MIVLALSALTVALAALLVVGREVIALVFASILFAVFLKGCGRLITRWIKVPPPWDVAVVWSLMLLGMAVIVFNLASHIAEQMQEMSRQMTQAWVWLREQVRSSPLLDSLVPAGQSLPETVADETGGAATVVRGAWATFGGMFSLFVVAVGGTYFAIDRQRYAQGLVALVRPRGRERARELMDELGENLWRWLLARLFSMAVVGVASAILLAVLGVPMPLTLGVLAALLTFLPNIGAVLALLLPAALGFQQGTGIGIAVVIGYVVLQIVESYVLTPLVQQSFVQLPAALVLFSQILGGAVLGMLGVALAPPAVLVIVVLVRRLYVERMETEEDGKSRLIEKG